MVLDDFIFLKAVLIVQMSAWVPLGSHDITVATDAVLIELVSNLSFKIDGGLLKVYQNVGEMRLICCVPFYYLF